MPILTNTGGGSGVFGRGVTNSTLMLWFRRYLVNIDTHMLFTFRYKGLFIASCPDAKEGAVTLNLHRVAEPLSSSRSTAEGSSTRTGPRRPAAFAAALAAAVLMLGGTPAAAEPTFKTDYANVGAPAGYYITVGAEYHFNNQGTNPKFTDVSFSTTEWYSDSGITSDGRIFVEIKTADDLNALSSPPPTPFTATATMTNDEGETASGTFTFETYWARQEDTSSTPSGPAPSLPRHGHEEENGRCRRPP
ncbi:MAG: hypothetical protein OXE86_14235 [Alphaproteobacteria bacterium]|nr:hypothetical protein [Alphaproteobacteria bacterium]